MLNAAAVAIGGALGALGRYWFSSLLYKQFGTAFPYGTLGVNVVGSLLMGVVFVLIQDRGLPEPWRLALAVGLLGAFTTFSTFSLDALLLVEQGFVAKAVLYTLASVVLCLLAAAAGIWMTRSLQLV